jgi:hypothetical protein
VAAPVAVQEAAIAGAPAPVAVVGQDAGPPQQDAPCSPVSLARSSFLSIDNFAVILLHNDEWGLGADDDACQSDSRTSGQPPSSAQRSYVHDFGQRKPTGSYTERLSRESLGGQNPQVQHGSDNDTVIPSGCGCRSNGAASSVWRKVVSAGAALCPKSCSCSCSSMRWLKSQVHRAREWVAGHLNHRDDDGDDDDDGWPDDGWMGLASRGSLPVQAHGGLVSPVGTAVAAGVVLMASICSAGGAGQLPAGVFSCPLA